MLAKDLEAKEREEDASLSDDGEVERNRDDYESENVEIERSEDDYESENVVERNGDEFEEVERQRDDSVNTAGKVITVLLQCA